MRLFSTLILTLLLSLTLVQPASAYTVQTNHPRLWINENTDNTVIAKCNSALSTEYATFKGYVDTHVVGDSYPLGSEEDYPKDMRYLALCHIVESPADTSYYDQMKDMMTYVHAQANWEQSRYYLDAQAFFYDWANAKLAAQQLDDNHGDSLGVALNWHTNNFTTWYLSNAGHSKLSRLRELTAGSIALYGDGHNDAAATAGCDTLFAHVFNDPHCIAMIDSIARDGGYFEGEYNRTSLRWFVEALCMIESGCTDVAPFDSTSCVPAWGDYIVWDTMCRSGLPANAYAFGMGKQGDSFRAAGARDALRNLVNMLADKCDDANVMWLEDQFAAHASLVNSNSWWFYIVNHDTALAGISPVTAGWPLAKHYEVGTVYGRNGWDLSTASEDVWMVYRHEQYPFGHAHADVGHFSIARGQDLLLIDAGYYVGGGATTHHTEYFSQTIAHNSITVKLFGETFTEATENTGGQNMGAGVHPVTVGAYTDSMAANSGRGDITDFTVVGDTLVYVRSDMTSAYTAAKVDTVRREFVWLEPKNTFLIFDTVKLDSTGYLQKQLFHMIPNPTTLTSAARWTQGDGTMKLTSLFGTGDVTITEVGGTGHHFDCNGTNYGTEEQEEDEGDYRLELSPGRSADHRWMLTALQVTASADTSYSTLALIETGDYIGAAVDTDTILFHKYGGAYATGGQGNGGNGGDAEAGGRPVALSTTGRYRGRRGRR